MHEKFKSDVSGREFPKKERVMGSAIRDSLMAYIRKEHPDFDKGSNLARSELNDYRSRFISVYLKEQISDLSEEENMVLDSLRDRTSLTSQLDPDDDKAPTIGQRIADRVASFGGSWVFIISFGLFILIWISINVIILTGGSFDPYPFILLNLLLSCLAAVQAPVIMMSQNRQEDKDRSRNKKDYMINLKSELEIRILHEKLDHLMMTQQQELIEMQNEQIRMLEKILRELRASAESEKKTTNS